MQKNSVEPWMEICALAAKEQDPGKFMKLTHEVIRLLDEKNKRPNRADVSDSE
jgi:hypothetical protein